MEATSVQRNDDTKKIILAMKEYHNKTGTIFIAIYRIRIGKDPYIFAGSRLATSILEKDTDLTYYLGLFGFII
jgi:hypothetical protein